MTSLPYCSRGPDSTPVLGVLGGGRHLSEASYVITSASHQQYEELKYFFLFFLAAPCSGLWDLSSLTRDPTRAPAVKVRSPNHWTARELPKIFSFFLSFFFLEIHNLINLGKYT